MADDAGLTGQDDIISDLGAARNADLRADDAVFPDDHVVGDHDEIVDLRPLADHGAPEAGAVDRRVGTDLHVVLDHDDAALRDFVVLAVACVVAEAVRADNRAAMQNNPVAENASVAQDGVRMEATIRSEARVLADVRPGHDDAARADDGTGHDDGILAHAGLGRDLRAGMHDRRRMDARGRRGRLANKLRGDTRERTRGIVDADAGG